MDGMNKEHWPGKGYPSSGMEAHIDQFAVGMRISEVPSSIIVNDRLDDDSFTCPAHHPGCSSKHGIA